MLLVTLTCTFIILFYIDRGEAECTLYPQTLYQCKNSDTKTIWEAKMKDGDGKAKILNFKIDLSEDLDESSNFELVIDNWENGMWYNLHMQSGNACENLMQMFKDAWVKITKKIEPQLEEECGVKKGHYEVKDMEFERSDVSFDVDDHIKSLKVTLKLYTKDGALLVCGVIEIDVECS